MERLVPLFLFRHHFSHWLLMLFLIPLRLMVTCMVTVEMNQNSNQASGGRMKRLRFKEREGFKRAELRRRKHFDIPSFEASFTLSLSLQQLRDVILQ